MSQTELELRPVTSLPVGTAVAGTPVANLRTESIKSDQAPILDHRNLTAMERQKSPSLSHVKSALIIMIVSSMTFMTSLLGGMLTVGLPTIARDVNLPENLLLW